MKSKIPMIVRILLGLVFFVSGVMGLLNLVPTPPDLPEKLIIFNKGLEASGYMMTLIKVTEAVCGLMLLSGFFVPLALVVLAPVMLNIFLVHLFLAPQGLPIAIVMGILMTYLAFFAQPYAARIRILFQAK